MKPSLQLRFSQQLTLTPQLQQSIKLLQMSTLELNQELEQILNENPLLERDDDPLGNALSIAPNGAIDRRDDAAPQATPEPQPENAASDTPDAREVSSDNGYEDFGSSADWSSSGGTRTRNDDNDEIDYPQLAAAEVGLAEHLLTQLTATQVSARDRALVELLIGELDDDGYLRSSLADVQSSLPAELEIEDDELRSALNLLQSFDPTGVGARDLRESLLLQLDAAADAHDDSPDTWRLARSIVDLHLGLLAARDFTKLRRLLRCDEDGLRDAQTLIVSLSPRPGAQFAPAATNYVTPDVIVRRSGSDWQVSLNPDVMPKLRVNDMYANILRRNRGSAGAMSGQLQEARWLIKNVQQRFDTILRVSQAIVDRQKAFFSHGEVAMRPLVLREIADTLGLHESTVSRVTTQKYMLTPHGTFELKYFFGSHVATDSGGAASSTAIRALIKNLVAEEDSRKPLSDNQIAELLGKQGIVVARRTIAKYREALKIPPVSQRKSL